MVRYVSHQLRSLPVKTGAIAGKRLRPTAPLLSFPTDAASSANVRGSMLRANLDSRQLDVVSLARTISSPGAHCLLVVGRVWSCRKHGSGCVLADDLRELLSRSAGRNDI